jgi:hypothetical protein
VAFRRTLLVIACTAACAAALSAQAADWMQVSDPLAAPVRPRDGAAVQQTPPDFSWPDVGRDAQYAVTLTYPDGRSRTLKAPQNYINWDEVLPPGSYSWTVSVNGTQASRPRRFSVGAEAKPFLAPDLDALAKRVKARPHPRGLPDAATLALMASQRPQGVAKLRAEVDMRMKAPLPPMPDTGSAGADNSRVYEEVKRALSALSAFALLNEKKYFDEARRRVMNMAAWDPNGPTAYTRHGVNMSARTMTFALALGYDWLHSALSKDEKELLLRSIKARLGHMHADVIGTRSRVAAHPRDSHGQLTATMLGMMATLLLGDLDDAERWMRAALPLAINMTQPWGGDEGGFSNGTPYALWDTGDLQPHWYVMRWASGIDFAQKGWVRNYARFLAYFNPPGTPARLFGDGHEQAQLAEQSARFGKGYTYFAPSPLGRWYASRLSGEDAMRFEYLMAPPADFSGQAPFPKDTPNSLYLPTTGWVAMHSDLADSARTSVYFKSSPRPHGAFAHQHADQNSFVVNAGGERLAIESGYYDGYKTRHWWNWLKATRAKNAITYDGGQGQIFFEATDYKKMGYGSVTRFESGRDYDIVSGDATEAYDGALSLAQRSLVYLRPGLLLVHDRLASATPRRWEWNIHALKQMQVLPDGGIEIQGHKQRLCVQMLASPQAKFSQTSDWLAPGPTRGDGRLHEGAAPLKGEPQWHGRFSSAPLPAAEFIALLDVGCSSRKPVLQQAGDGWKIRLADKIVEIGKEVTVR